MLVAMVLLLVPVVMMVAMVPGTLTKFPFHQASPPLSDSLHSSPSHHKHPFP
jgi:hypothetical protein